MTIRKDQRCAYYDIVQCYKYGIKTCPFDLIFANWRRHEPLPKTLEAEIAFSENSHNLTTLDAQIKSRQKFGFALVPERDDQ